MKVGFVGLGIMGRPMAHNLIKGGHQLFVYGKRTVPSEIREGATVCDTLKSVAEQAEVIIIMVPDTPDVQNVLFSGDGVAAAGRVRCTTAGDARRPLAGSTRRLRARPTCRRGRGNDRT